MYCFPVCFDISIHPPREGWDKVAYNVPSLLWISIHPPREGWDWKRRI